MESTSLHALSPIDGRYAAAAAPLREIFSEAGLIRERICVEALWLQHLCAGLPQLPGAQIGAAVSAELAAIHADPGPAAPIRVKAIELGINHDVKAVEYYLRERLTAVGASAATLELVHFGCTSEDINNLAYARMLRAARNQVLLPEIERIQRALAELATTHAALPMLARTHGQPASPTTLGKEVANVHARLKRGARRFDQVEILGKWNGAVGNFNAQVSAVPDADWRALSLKFVEAQRLHCNPFSTQIEPHDWIGEYCDALAALNIILVDLCRDFWGYIALGYLRQKARAGEVGSSTMPHKVNPIDFENAEGNFGIANALLRHFSDKLPISRWQRDLTDSTVLRNLGVACAHTLIGWKALQRGLARVEPDVVRMNEDLDEAWEVLAEPIQTVLRAAAIPGGYELLKEFTRGQKITRDGLFRFIETLPLPDAERRRLQNLRPHDYVGLAAELARAAVTPAISKV
jgi:adenylosuccinate lyase